MTKRTTRLVIGDGFTGDDPADFHTGKAAKAMLLREKGQQIEVLTEVEFQSIIAEAETSGTLRLTIPRRVIEFRSPDVEALDRPEQTLSAPWEWFNQSLKVETRAIGGEPCR